MLGAVKMGSGFDVKLRFESGHSEAGDEDEGHVGGAGRAGQQQQQRADAVRGHDPRS